MCCGIAVDDWLRGAISTVALLSQCVLMVVFALLVVI